VQNFSATASAAHYRERQDCGKIAEGQTLTVNALRVLHGPYGFVTR
jgi:hypothetical protein